MAKEVTAYVAKDGSIHLDKEAADRIDFVFDLSDDVTDFLSFQKAQDKDGTLKRLIVCWERWRMENVPDRTHPVVIEPVAKQPAASVVLPKSAPVSPKIHKRKVGIVGVWSGNQASIKKEFGDKLDLYIYSPDDVNKLQGAKELHKIFVMRKFVGHRHTDILRAIGQEPLLINGGMGDLKDALTTYAGVE